MYSRDDFELSASETLEHTPGPWAWFGGRNDLYLATTHSGRKYVMGFKRRGLNGAEPMFRVNDRMVAASELVEFEVGDGVARGFKQGDADPSVYRYDVRGIDCADARLIAAAPDMLTALLALNAGARPSNWDDEDIDDGERDAWRQLDAALAKALTKDPTHD